jgi:hypothetical protein
MAIKFYSHSKYIASIISRSNCYYAIPVIRTLSSHPRISKKALRTTQSLGELEIREGLRNTFCLCYPCFNKKPNQSVLDCRSIRCEAVLRSYLIPVFRRFATSLSCPISFPTKLYSGRPALRPAGHASHVQKLSRSFCQT